MVVGALVADDAVVDEDAVEDDVVVEESVVEAAGAAAVVVDVEDGTLAGADCPFIGGDTTGAGAGAGIGAIIGDPCS